MIPYEYEYFGSARAPATKSSMYKRPHRILVLLHTTHDELSMFFGTYHIVRIRVKIPGTHESHK